MSINTLSTSTIYLLSWKSHLSLGFANCGYLVVFWNRVKISFTLQISSRSAVISLRNISFPNKSCLEFDSKVASCKSAGLAKSGEFMESSWNRLLEMGQIVGKPCDKVVRWGCCTHYGSCTHHTYKVYANPHYNYNTVYSRFNI